MSMFNRRKKRPTSFGYGGTSAMPYSTTAVDVDFTNLDYGSPSDSSSDSSSSSSCDGGGSSE